ncbi:MAG: Ig-like domain-containing protein, partial [Planctomycetaceae bacterium]
MSRCLRISLVCAALVLSLASRLPAEQTVEPKGLGDPGTLTALELGPETRFLPGNPVSGEQPDHRDQKPGISENTGFLAVLRSRDARQQLIVTGRYSSGQLRDLTHAVTYSADPAGIVEIDSTGLVTPLADGTVKVIATHSGGLKAEAALNVTGVAEQVPINFGNQIVPIFTKLGCNSGGCHGKASGQNGFKLSLLGFEPPEDYEHLVKEGHGRRLFPAAPDRSLLLLKASGSVPHGGGARIEADSAPYRVLRRWIEQGMPYGKPDDPVVARIEVYPTERT